MRKSNSRRRLIALAAVYLVALQALLLPLSVAAGSPFVGPPCSTSASAQANQLPSQPVSHDTGCPCAAGCGMQCCAQALAAPPPELSVRVPVVGYAMAPQVAPVVTARTADTKPVDPARAARRLIASNSRHTFIRIDDAGRAFKGRVTLLRRTPR